MDFSSTHLRFLASVLVSGAATQKHLDAAAELAVAVADAKEGGLSLVDFAREGAPPRSAPVIQFKPRGRIPVPPRDGSAA